MPLLADQSKDLLELRLNRDLTRFIKRGHPWVYADALRTVPSAKSGTRAVLLDNQRGQPIAWGFFTNDSPLAFRACSVDPDFPANERWAGFRLADACALRTRWFNSQTTGYRLVNGEGDRLPGLVVDQYARTAVMKFDGPGPAGFWNAEGLAEWLAAQQDLDAVYERPRDRSEKGQSRFGPVPQLPVPFLENGLAFTSDVVSGQKTGFFLDQRDNRHMVHQLAAGQRVLNLFAYTGGFSIAAGVGNAAHVTSVDVAAPAVDMIATHWALNGLASENQTSVTADVFEFLEDARQTKQKWDLAIVDPPSFAPSAQSVPQAIAAYQKLFAVSASVVTRGGFLFAASCSSHVPMEVFTTLCEESVSQARRRATVVATTTHAIDHPTPLALPEFRYLKCVVLRLD